MKVVRFKKELYTCKVFDNSSIMQVNMDNLSFALLFMVDLSKAQAAINRRFDSKLSLYGLGFNDFVILLHLFRAPGKKLRRIDLAEAVGITASGVTRLLLPLEKIGLVSRQSNERDARVSYVVLTSTGEKLLQEALEVAERTAKEMLPPMKEKTKEEFNTVLRTIGG